MSEWFRDDGAIAAIPADDRAAQYGDGLFETIAIRDSAPRMWLYHLERLQLGCERLGLAAPTAATLQTITASAIAATTVDTAYACAKLVVAAGIGERGYQRTATAPLIRVGMFNATRRPAEAYREGVRVRLCATRLAVQPQLAGVKTLNRIEQVLARAEWDDAAIAEGLTLDTGGRLICGTMSNVFARIDDKLVTPAMTRCGVAGVMRRHLLTELTHQGIAVDVRDIQQEELADIQEMLLTNSQFGVLPVARFEERTLPIGDVTRNIMAVAASSGIEECAT